MTRDPVTIGPKERVAAAARMLREGQIRHLPVVDDDDRLVGIISERDLRGAAFSSVLWAHLSPTLRARFEQAHRALEEIEVGGVMTWHPVTATPDATLAEAAAQMFERRIGCLPVVEGGRLVGLLTEADALAALADILGPRARLELEWLIGPRGRR